MKRSEFLSALAKHGATLDTDSEDYDLNIDSPSGRVFSANGCHCICIPWNNSGGQSWKTEAYQEGVTQVSMGTYDCPDPDCDVCHGEDDE